MWEIIDDNGTVCSGDKEDMRNNKTSFELQSVLKKDTNGTYLCICNNCMTIMVDQNSQVNSKKYNTDCISTEEMKYSQEDGSWLCPICETDDYLMDL